MTMHVQWSELDLTPHQQLGHMEMGLSAQSYQKIAEAGD